MSTSALQPAASMKGISTAPLKLRVLRLHAVLGSVISKRHVARQRAYEFERAVELVNDRGVSTAGERKLQLMTTL